MNLISRATVNLCKKIFQNPSRDCDRAKKNTHGELIIVKKLELS